MKTTESKTLIQKDITESKPIRIVKDFTPDYTLFQIN